MRNSIYTTQYTKQLNVETALSAANYPTSTSYIDVNGFRRFAFEIHLGALDSALTFQVKQDTSATETASIKNVTGATITTGTSGAGADNYDLCIEVDAAALDTNNGFRYVTLAVSGPSGNDYACIVFKAWLGADLPVTQPATFRSADAVFVSG